MLRRRSIRLRIIVLVLAPVIALFGLYAVVLNLTLGNILTLQREAAIRTDVAIPVAHVQTQLGFERTLALLYIVQPTSANLDLLIQQERRTDAAIKAYRLAVSEALSKGPVPKEQQALLSWQAHLGEMNQLRTRVLSDGLLTSAAAEAYSSKLAEGDNVLNQAIIPVLTGPLGIQATDILNMARADQALGEEGSLMRADLTAHSFTPSDVQLIDQLIISHRVQSNQTLSDLEPALRSYFGALYQTPAAQQVQSMEAVILGPGGPRKISPSEWTSATTAYQSEQLRVLLQCAATLASQARTTAEGLVKNLILIAGLGLLAIAVAIGIGIILGRGLIRQLNDLRQSAVALSSDQLPSAIERLRAGEDVDVGAEVPELAASSDEIGQVRQAFNTAARTAVAAAVDEVRIRRGVNDVFRNLARRNQSLLTRQLQLLDGMERRVHDPEELADLFRIDHLTTRMRRHAEGLLIVAGGSSGRTWREPVPIIDVMRAAVAEVEDYTRIRVTSRTGASVAGHAVADIIHLLAELVENATTFSPASTHVRLDGDKVARGIVVEVEDRGLGMNESQIEQLNATLAEPPLFDPSGSDQLGLFIAGQLARRHDIRITLRSSPYGGITAVVLIPTALTVDSDEEEQPAIASIRELGGRPIAELPGGPAEPSPSITIAAAAAAAVAGPVTAVRTAASDAEDHLGAAQSPATAATGDNTTWQHEAGVTWTETAWTGTDSGRADRAPSLPLPPAPAGLSWSAGGPAADGSEAAGSANGDHGNGGRFGAASHRSGPSGLGLSESDPAALNQDDIDGLPVRVRQASLAPQLRHEKVMVQPEPAALASEPSPEAARSTMAALQHGWERGRSVSERIADEFGTYPGPQRPGDSPDEGTGGAT
ncbi:MAG TPA: nitrate- and nitrite sensing domain-containing protein [Streptosporangiaceae bacterium]